MERDVPHWLPSLRAFCSRGLGVPTRVAEPPIDRPTRAAVAARAAAAVLWLSGCGDILPPRATLGPGAIVRGRGLYNEVISETNNEQTLELIVRARYGEPWGLLSVASVTANLRATATTNAQFGVGTTANYQGNLVPLSAGLAYEENPTISYTPVQGERYAKGILSPVGLDVLVLLLGTEGAPDRLISILVRHINGLQNPAYGPPAARAAFQAAIDILARLEAAGEATWTTSATGSSFALVIHDYPSDRESVRELLRRWGLAESMARRDRDIVLPVSLTFGSPTTPALNLQTRSVYELIHMAASAVEVPPEHAALGLADTGLDGISPLRGLLKIASSPHRPSGDVLIAVRHRGYWFSIAADDGPSKLAFRLFQTLINMRLVESAPQTTPTLTIPVK